ncbi:hypothetical protein [Corynebacterium bovis]|uniref:hypothetical protein n=1 Tax=Corynebacterium bovis TaxID=36808 RepID=UPI003CC75BF3
MSSQVSQVSPLSPVQPVLRVPPVPSRPSDTMIEAGDPVQENPVRTDNIGMTFLGFWRPTG